VTLLGEIEEGCAPLESRPHTENGSSGHGLDDARGVPARPL